MKWFVARQGELHLEFFNSIVTKKGSAEFETCVRDLLWIRKLSAMRQSRPNVIAFVRRPFSLATDQVQKH
jgi:hypothetical protein